MRIRVALIGAGRWAERKHLPALHYIAVEQPEGFQIEVSALCDRDAGRAADLAARFAIPKVYNEVGALVAAGGVDCYAVSVRPADLPAVLDQLTPTGLPILTEKPPGLNAKTAARLAETVTVPNVVGFNRRFFPIVETFRRRLADGDDLYFVQASMHRHDRHDSSLFRLGASAHGAPFVTGTAIHTINTLEYLLGTISACESRREIGGDGEPYWLADLRFENGAVGRLSILPSCGVSTERIEVHAPRRSLYLKYSMYSESDLPGSIEVHAGGRLVDVFEGDHSLPSPVAEGFVGEYLELMRAVAGENPTTSTLRSSVNTMRVAEMIELKMPRPG